MRKAERRKLLSDAERKRVAALSDDELLALHDLTHDLMEARHGSRDRHSAR